VGCPFLKDLTTALNKSKLNPDEKESRLKIKQKQQCMLSSLILIG
jgi:hypothetical protein